jgi:hypothetical protein
VQIKLYSENDTRPVGTYEFACSAYVSPFSILFVSQTGVQVLSSLRSKITLDPGDSLIHNTMNQTYEITGVTKKEFTRLADEAEAEKELKDADAKAKRTSRSNQPRSTVPEESSYAGNDPDEITKPRSLRKASTRGNSGQEGFMFPTGAARID